MSVGTFLADENGSIPSTCYGGERRTVGGYGNDTGGNERDHRGYSVREELPLPTQPPYTAHIGNLSFEATQADISDLFADCEVTNVRIVEDKMTRAPKGFGYVEFATLEGLKKALSFQGTLLQGRNIRVSVAEPPKERQDTRDYSDWSRKGPLPDAPSQRRVSDRAGFGPRGQDSMSDAGGDRPGRRPFEPADGKVRDYGNWERKGPLSPSLPTASLAREGGRPRSKDGPQFRRASPAWGEARSQDGSRPPRRDFHERPVERAPTAPELDNQWRARMRPDAPPPKQTPSAPEVAPTAAQPAPAQRPKLNLQKRTVEAEPASPTTPGDSKSSPFGGARPIDTSAREREVEEKRQLALRQKREAEEKAKAEKAEKAEKQKAAKEQDQQAKEQEASKTENLNATIANGSKEDDAGAPQAGKNIEILRRSGNTEETPAVEGSTEAGTSGEKSESPKEQPREQARQQVPSKTNGNWRNGAPRSRGPSHGHAPPRGPQGQAKAQQPKAAVSDPAVSPVPAEPEEEGWSTVSSKQRNNRRGNQTRG
ncbi:conserved hypothetical protein [Histoplasma mississippiense (nom. inval.)]|uniref:conserved hypothetical protein n=1 Tax=Ajellomyces capsulatus (strain NAm1 / WU24) TaxID=2059318 RepID=UPI000157CA77|nr:conserved hypothetical protein [Histoplasma mississippiense (nom. inval.)]EDN09311.1 conserved hypothetical protein [Histoplasma mississippiense (nom. inval.)]